MIDCLIVCFNILYVTVYIYVYVYCGSCATRFGLCLDFVIGSCESLLLQMYGKPLTLMFAPLFVECLLRDLNFMFRDNVFAEPLQCRNGVNHF